MKSRINNDYVLSIISKFFNILFGFLSLMLINRYLGAELKGRYSSLLNYVTIIVSVLYFGVSTIYPKYKRKKINNCFEIFISLVLIQFFIYVFFGLIIICFFKFDFSIMAIVTISCFSILTTQLRYINLVENIKYNSFVVTVMSISNFVITLLIFLFVDRNLYVGLFVYLLKELVVIFLILFKVSFKSLFKKEYIKYYKEIIISGILPMLSCLLIILNYKVDILMLNIYNVDYALIGLYSLGLSISEYIWIIPEIFKDVIQKRTAKDNALDSINFSLRISTTLVLFMYLFIVLIGKQIFGLVFGDEYVDSYYVTLILFVGVYSMVYYKIIGQLFIADNKSKQYFMILLGGAVLNIIVNFLLIPMYDIDGAAIASVASYSLIGIVFLILYIKYYRVKLKDLLIIKISDIKKILNFINVK